MNFIKRWCNERAEREEEADRLVWDYILTIEQNAFPPAHILLGTIEYYNYAKEARDKIIDSFEKMMAEVNKCPKKFRNKMARRIELSGCLNF